MKTVKFLPVLISLFMIIILIFGYNRKIFSSNYVKIMIKENKLKFQPYKKPEFSPNFKKWKNDRISFCFFGHSTVLINLFGTYIITDPVLFKRIGPPEFANNIFGIRRVQRVPIKIKDLPEISYILISHAHYDHLDLPSITAIIEKQKLHPPQIITPVKTSYIYKKENSKYLLELGWNKSFTDRNLHLKIRSFRVEHYGNVYGTSRKSKSECNGYVIIKNKMTIAFFGDTSFYKYSDKNGIAHINIDWKKQTGNFKKINLAILPIGDYYYSAHISPAQAIKIAFQINAEKILPIHYDTFILSPPEKYKNSPDNELKSIIRKNKIEFTNYEVNKNKFPEVGLTCYIE